MMTGMILVYPKKFFETIDHTHFCKNYMVLRRVLLIVLNLISSTDLFWLISEKIFLSLRLFPAVYRKVLFCSPLFLVYVNDMPQAVKCDLFLYAFLYFISFSLFLSFLLFSVNIKIFMKINGSLIRIFLWFVDKHGHFG